MYIQFTSCVQGDEKLILHVIPKFYLISWWENFVERHSFRNVSGDFGILCSTLNSISEFKGIN